MDKRIQKIADAAVRLFLSQGYAKTQINHIAKAVGVSVGTIYLDFAGKKEIMHFILKCTVSPSFMDRDFDRPITDDLFDGIENEIINLFDELGKEFESNLGNNDYSFEDLISDTFDMFSRYAVGCLFIEKNRFDFKRLADHYTAYRKKFLKDMMHYIERFIEKGTVRPLENIELSITLIIEILSWWAMDIRYTSFETRDIPAELAKKTCLDNIIHAYGL